MGRLGSSILGCVPQNQDDDALMDVIPFSTEGGPTRDEWDLPQFQNELPGPSLNGTKGRSPYACGSLADFSVLSIVLVGLDEMGRSGRPVGTVISRAEVRAKGQDAGAAPQGIGNRSDRGSRTR
jgi:hypothetical protein